MAYSKEAVDENFKEWPKLTRPISYNT